MIRTKLIFLATALACTVAIAQQQTPEQARQDAIAEFTKKQQAANWPEKFARIGNQMGVPSDILAAVAFAETRWEHLKWPPGETSSPENGMPRGYGIMFLQDNNYFGHSLIEAAQLIGKTPDDLKEDPELNIRGAAALLKKLYDENPKPDFANSDQIESWYNAVIKYCGIPEPFLSHQHALNCYVYMSKGYNQYGMYWQPHPVNVEPMRADVVKLRKEFDEAVRRKQATNTVVDDVQPPASDIVSKAATNTSMPKPVVAATAVQSQTQQVGFNLWRWLGMALFLVVIYLIIRARLKHRP